MAKKKAAKKTVKKATKKKAATPQHVVPADCGPLVDCLLGIMEDDEKFDLEEVRLDFQACTDFLANLPDDTQPWQMDLSEFSFTTEAEKLIKRYIAAHQYAPAKQLRKASLDNLLAGLLYVRTGT